MKIGNRKLNHWLRHRVQVKFNLCICAKSVVDKNSKAAFMKEEFETCLSLSLGVNGALDLCSDA